jgi:hypothetical protein
MNRCYRSSTPCNLMNNLDTGDPHMPCTVVIVSHLRSTGIQSGKQHMFQIRGTFHTPLLDNSHTYPYIHIYYLIQPAQATCRECILGRPHSRRQRKCSWGSYSMEHRCSPPIGTPSSSWNILPIGTRYHNWSNRRRSRPRTWAGRRGRW